MKILHVIPNISPRFGGPSRACRDLSKAQTLSGDAVTIFTTNCDFPSGHLDVPTDTTVEEDGYSIRYFPVEFTSYMVSSAMFSSLRRQLSEFDIVHIHGLYRFPHAITAYLARRRDIPYIVTPHGSLDPFLFNNRRNRARKRIYEYFVELPNLRKSAAIHFTCEEEMMLTQSLRLNSTKIIIPRALDLSECRALPLRGTFRTKHHLGDAKIILHFGRINFKKGLDILVKAFAQVALERNDVFLVLAGPDNDGYGAKVRGWVEKEGLQAKTLFTGMLQGQDKLELLADADLFVLPSYTENFGIAVVEAMACNLPVIISNKVNIWREIQNAGAGLVCNCDAEEVSKNILRLLSDGDLQKTMVRAGNKLVRDDYDWEKVAERFSEAYRSIVKK